MNQELDKGVPRAARRGIGSAQFSSLSFDCYISAKTLLTMNTTGKSLFDSRLCQPCAAIFNGACFDPWSPQSSKSPDEGENVKSSLATHPRYHARTSIHSVSELWACASSLQCNICQFIWDRTRFRPSLPKLSEVLDRTVTATVFWANGPMNSKLQPAAIVLDMEMSFTITDFKVPGGSESGRICDLCLWPSSGKPRNLTMSFATRKFDQEQTSNIL